jgi:PKD repeat protein
MSVVLEEGSYTVSMPSTWTVGPDQYRFLRWEDASTSTSRVVSLTVDMALIATYAKLVPPIASFTFSPTDPSTNETVALNASASDDPDGTIVSYDWDFGDGASGNGLIAEHAYTVAGNYTITLTVTDNDGLSQTMRKDIEVKEAPSTGIPLELYMAVIGIMVITIIAIAFYYLKSRARRAHEKKNNT